MKEKQNSKVRLLLQVACIGLLLGWAGLHLSKGGPYRAFFLNDYIFRPFAEVILGWDWNAHLQDLDFAEKLNYFGKGVGIFFLGGVLLVAFLPRIPKPVAKVVLWACTLQLVFIAFCRFLDKGWALGQFFEYSAQFCTPVLLYYYYFGNIRQARFLFYLKAAIALTFFCHGLYAVGYYSRPGFFVDMMINGFGVSQGTAIFLLDLAGCLDFLVAACLFLPWRRVVITAAIWAVIWGLLTTFARVYANLYWDLLWDSLVQWTPEALLRFPHFLLAVIVLVQVRESEKTGQE